MYILRWIGSNEDPDIFRYAYATQSFPPKGGNRGRYSNARVDALLQAASAETDQEVRRKEYVEVQQILADELPSIPLWYHNNEVLHSTRLTGVKLEPGGGFAFLRNAELLNVKARSRPTAVYACKDTTAPYCAVGERLSCRVKWIPAESLRPVAVEDPGLNSVPVRCVDPVPAETTVLFPAPTYANVQYCWPPSSAFV